MEFGREKFGQPKSSTFPKPTWARTTCLFIGISTDKQSMVDIAYYKRINSEFYRRIGVINCVERLNKMGLEPQDIIGTFYLRDVEKLFEICEEYTNLHIITYIDSTLTVNRFVHGDFLFRLAEGDGDPTIELRFPPEVGNHFLAELNHFIRRCGLGF